MFKRQRHVGECTYAARMPRFGAVLVALVVALLVFELAALVYVLVML